MLARIRDIQPRKTPFVPKGARFLFALAEDYDKSDEATQTFFATVQNLLLYAVTPKDSSRTHRGPRQPADPHFGLLTWKGAQVRKHDLFGGKNFPVSNRSGHLEPVGGDLLGNSRVAHKRQTITSMGFLARERWGRSLVQRVPAAQQGGAVSHAAWSKRWSRYIWTLTSAARPKKRVLRMRRIRTDLKR